MLFFAYLATMYETASVFPNGESAGKLMKAMKNPTIWTTIPNKTIGFRLYLIVFLPNRPKVAPPTIPKNIQAWHEYILV